jgi:hypothetical protein
MARTRATAARSYLLVGVSGQGRRRVCFYLCSMLENKARRRKHYGLLQLLPDSGEALTHSDPRFYCQAF